MTLLRYYGILYMMRKMSGNAGPEGGIIMDGFKKKIKKRIVLSSVGICAGLILFIALQAMLGVTIGLSAIVVYTSVAFVVLYIAFYITYMKSVLKDPEKLQKLYSHEHETVTYKIIVKAVYIAFSVSALAVAIAAPLFAIFIDELTGVVLMFVLITMMASFAAGYVCLGREPSDKDDNEQ